MAREVMVPRIDMITLEVNTSLSDALDAIIAAGHSRIPVFEGNVDVIVGILYARTCSSASATIALTYRSASCCDRPILCRPARR